MYPASSQCLNRCKEVERRRHSNTNGMETLRSGRVSVTVNCCWLDGQSTGSRFGLFRLAVMWDDVGRRDNMLDILRATTNSLA